MGRSGTKTRGWAADSASVLFVQYSRDMSWAGVYRADAVTGEAVIG